MLVATRNPNTGTVRTPAQLVDVVAHNEGTKSAYAWARGRAQVLRELSSRDYMARPHRQAERAANLERAAQFDVEAERMYAIAWG